MRLLSITLGLLLAAGSFGCQEGGFDSSGQANLSHNARLGSEGEDSAKSGAAKSVGKAHPWSASPWASLSQNGDDASAKSDIGTRRDALTPLSCDPDEVCSSGESITSNCFLTISTARSSKDFAQTLIADKSGWVTHLRLMGRKVRDVEATDTLSVGVYRLQEGDPVPTSLDHAFAGSILNSGDLAAILGPEGEDTVVTLPIAWNPDPDLRVEPLDEDGNPTRLAFTVSASPGLLVFGAGCFNGDEYPDGEAYERNRRVIPGPDGSTGLFFSDSPFLPYNRDLAFALGVSDNEPGSAVSVVSYEPQGENASTIAQLRIRFTSNVRASTLYMPGQVQNIEVEGPPGFDTSYAFNFEPSTAEATLHFLNQLPPDETFTVTIKGGPEGVRSTTQMPLIGNAEGEGQDFVWSFKTRPRGVGEPWYGGFASGASVSTSPVGASESYTLFSVTGTPDVLTIDDATDVSYRLKAGFFYAAQKVSP